MPKIFKPPEARKSEGRIQRERDTLTPWLWISALQDFETVTFCWSRPQRVWSFIRQPYETNAGGWRLFTFTEPLASSCPAPIPKVLVKPPEKF